MNLKILLFAFSAVIGSSCSTTYKSGQTPDDVYYSPAKPIVEKEVVTEEKREQTRIVKREYADRQIVMSIHDPRWRLFSDDYDAYYDPYRYGYSCGYYYNPYYYPSPVYFTNCSFVNPKNSTPRMTNLGSYNYSNMVVVNPKSGYTRQFYSTRPYNNSNRDNNYSRNIIIPTTPAYNNTSPRSYDNSSNNTRTYSPSTNSSSSGSSSSGSSSGSSGAPVSRPHRGG